MNITRKVFSATIDKYVNYKVIATDFEEALHIIKAWRPASKITSITEDVGVVPLIREDILNETN